MAPINFDGDPTKIMTTCIDRPDINNCWFYKTPGECLFCENGYYVSATTNACVKASDLVPGCLSYDAAGCVHCDPLYYLDTTTKLCVLLPTTFTPIGQCASYSGTSSTTVVCDYCADGYAPNSPFTQCVSIGEVVPIEGCVYHATFDTCQTCGPTFYLNNGACTASPNNIPNCLAFSAVNVCAVCKPNYVLNSAGDACILVEDPNCLAHTSTLLCAVCNSGSYPDGAGACVADATKPGTSHCAVYNSAQTCIQCESTFYLDASNVCVKRPVADPNCSIYVNNVCTSCQDKYYLKSDNTCALGAIANCLQYSSSTTCTACDPNYIPSQDKTKCLANCLTLDSGNKCLHCVTGYYSNAGTCETATAITSCVVWDVIDKCLYCAAGTLLNPATGKCDAPVAGMSSTCNQKSTLCLRCQYGYDLQPDGTCVIQPSVPSNCLDLAPAVPPSTTRTCAICAFDQYMKTDGTCAPNSLSSQTCTCAAKWDSSCTAF